MDKTMKKRRNNRLLWTFFIALAFAVIPPMAYLTPLQNVFMRSEEAIRYGALFSGTVRWIHAGAIAAVWLLNMLFFYQNEKYGDSGDKLTARTRLQSWLNILLILLSVAAMIGYRFSVSADAWIGVFVLSSTEAIFTFWLPYIAVGLLTAWLACFCMCAAPATNCAVRDPIARWFDDKIKRAARNR